LEKIIKKKVINADRNLVEGDFLIKGSKKENIGLLIYGSPLTATTHISLIQGAEEYGVKYKVIYGASVFDAIAETGLQIYKFGKIASMPKWEESYHPTSFMEIVKDNQKIDAHSLILIDIGLEIKDAIKELEESSKEEKISFDKILICSGLGTGKKEIIYGEIKKLKNAKIKKPYCIIIPGKLHFVEEEVLKKFNL
jgi:diphthine synthase